MDILSYAPVKELFEQFFMRDAFIAGPAALCHYVRSQKKNSTEWQTNKIDIYIPNNFSFKIRSVLNDFFKIHNYTKLDEYFMWSYVHMKDVLGSYEFRCPTSDQIITCYVINKDLTPCVFMENNFDLTCNCVAYSKDGTYHITDSAVTDIDNGICRVVETYEKPITISVIEEYKARGFTFVNRPPPVNVFAVDASTVPKDVTCMICYEDFTTRTDSLQCFTCKNHVHDSCIKEWIQMAPKPECIYCRSSCWEGYAKYLQKTEIYASQQGVPNDTRPNTDDFVREILNGLFSVRGRSVNSSNSEIPRRYANLGNVLALAALASQLTS